jgi:uncharacterized protein
MATSSEEARNLDVVRRAFDAFQAGDVEALTKSFAPNVQYRVPPAGKFTGDYRGVSAVMEFFAQVAHESEGSFRATLVDLAASGNRVFALYKISGKRGGKTLDSTDVIVSTLADGAITEATVYSGDYPAAAAFWS